MGAIFNEGELVKRTFPSSEFVKSCDFAERAIVKCVDKFSCMKLAASLLFCASFLNHKKGRIILR